MKRIIFNCFKQCFGFDDDLPVVYHGNPTPSRYEMMLCINHEGIGPLTLPLFKLAVADDCAFVAQTKLYSNFFLLSRSSLLQRKTLSSSYEWRFRCIF